MALVRKIATKRWLGALEALTITRERPELTLPGLVPELAALHGAKLAFTGEDQSLTYRELAERCDHYANWSKNTGLQKGDVVGLLMPNCPEYPAVWLGITRTGVVVALLNTNLNGQAMEHSISSAGCKHVIVGVDLLPGLRGIPEKLPQPCKIWVHGQEQSGQFSRIDLIDRQESGDVTALSSPQDLALLIFTSGTTGLPKAARITHHRLMEWSLWFAGMMEITPDDRLYNCLPMYHSIGGVVAIGSMLVRGGSVVIRAQFSASRFWDDVIDNECTIFQYIGELCRYLLQTPSHPRETNHRLRLCCGNGLRFDVWEPFQNRFNIPHILEFYAATETNVSLYNCEEKPGAIGRVPPFLEHRFPIALIKSDPETGEIIRNESGYCVKCEIHEVGEAVGKILNTPESQFDGYTDPKAFASKILSNVFASGDRWVRTGDLLRKDADGYYYFVDRLGDSFRWKGENVSASEVAVVLAGCIGVCQSAVFAVAVPGNEGNAGMAAITVSEEFSLQKLKHHMAENLPSYARPLFIRICKSLAITGTFKITTAQLKREGYATVPASDSIWVYDDHADTFIPCDKKRLEWIADGGFAIKRR